jgi:Na+-translocating ferredoxin:NAD+ oxidoreductase RnfD subunit
MFDSTSPTSSTLFAPRDEDLPALSLWTFALGVLALLTFGLTSVPAIICGHRALAQASHSNKGSLGRSVALTGLVIGYAGAALMGTWIIVAARFLSMN